jgi:hypothetical protein
MGAVAHQRQAGRPTRGAGGLKLGSWLPGRRSAANLARLLGGSILLVVAQGCGAPEQDSCDEPTASEAAQWLEAVSSGNRVEALRLAASLAPADTWSAPPDPTYISLFEVNGVDRRFLTAEFNEWDFEYWSHAAFFSRLAREITAGADDPIAALFRAVTARLRAPDPPEAGILWPYRIWQLGQGYCDRQAWVLSELAWQWGADAKIVYLRDPVTLVSPHTICQLRGQGRVWVADPLSGVMLADVSSAQLAASPDRAREMWPNAPDWQRAITAARLWVPAYPHDYCRRNQALSARLRGCLGSSTPRFGEDPQARLRSSPEDLSGLPLDLWHYPIRLLAAEMSSN